MLRIACIGWLAVAALTGCGTCPEGFERSGGACQPAASNGDGVDEPLDAETFQDRFDDVACAELEDCVEDAMCEYPDCDVDIDCPSVDWTWAEDCSFDVEQAEECLSDSWACDDDGSEIWVTAPLSCELVFAC